MSYELRKILGNRYVMLLLALAVAVNAALFYRRCTKDLGGFTRVDIRAEYAHLDTLEQEYDALLNGIYGENVDIMQVPDEDLRRYALLSTVRDEVETTNNYPNTSAASALRPRPSCALACSLPIPLPSARWKRALRPTAPCSACGWSRPSRTAWRCCWTGG